MRRQHLIGALACLLPGVCLESQEFRATVSGLVVDASGAPLAGAKVVVTRLETNATAETLTNESGRYSVPFLSPGRYRISAERTPYRTTSLEGIVLRTAERVNVDLKLPIGAEEAIDVVAPLSADSNSSILSQTMDGGRVAELPLNGRQVYMLMQLTAGTLNNQILSGGGQAGTRAWDLNENYSIHGSRPGNNEFLIDGSPHSATGGWQYSPVVDAVEEFKVLASSVDASYGRTSGGIVNLALKSGTNRLRGSAFWFHRNDSLDANTTQNNRVGLPKQGHEFNNYGFVLSGPIQRDRTFVMGAFDGFRDQVPFPRTSTVPTERQRLGDFSQTFDARGNPITIYDPLTTRPDPGGSGRLIRDPFPGNRIPGDRIRPVALRLLPHIPLPNVAGDPLTGANNYLASPNVGTIRYDSYLLRLDHHFSQRHRMSVTSSGNWGAEFRSENGFPGPALRGNWPRGRDHFLNAVDHVWTLSVRHVLNLRASYDRFVGYNAADYAALDEDLRIQTPFQVLSQYPLITMDGYESLFPNSPRRTVNQIYAAQANASSSLGAHSVRWGAEFRAYSIERVSPGEGQGRFGFSRGFTQRDPLTGDAASGNAFASFLLGYPASGGVEVTSPSERRYLYGGVFVQDDWKLTARLSLTLGLRWDHQAPVTERLDRLTIGFDTVSPSPLQVPGLDLKGGLLFGGPGRRSPYRAEYGHFQPRLGATYRLAGSLAMRATFGRSYLPLSGAGQEGFLQTGFSVRTPFVATVQTGVPFNTLERPFPEGLLEPPGASRGLLTQAGSSVSFVNPNFRIPFVDQWSIGFTAALFGQLTVDAAYVGSRTRRLPIQRSINEIPRGERERGIARLGGSPSYLLEQVANPLAGRLPGTALNAPTVSRLQLLRPFPQFTGVTMEKEGAGSASYDALEVAAHVRRPGLIASATYTWMKSFESLGYLNNGYDARPWRAVASFDRTHRMTLTALWELPFGTAGTSARNVGGLWDRVIGGWQLGVIGELQSGTPTAMPGARLVLDTARLPAGEKSLRRWFDNSTRTNPRADGTYAWENFPPFEFVASNPRMSDVRDPWAPQWTLALIKNTPIKSRYILQLRLEAFNAFNTPIYGGPDLNVDSPSFGQVTPDQVNFPRHVQLGVKLTF